MDNRKDAKLLKRLLNPTLHSIGLHRCLAILIENSIHARQIEESLRNTYKHFHLIGCLSNQLHLMTLDLKATRLFQHCLISFDQIISAFANSRPLDVAFAQFCRSKGIRNFYLKRLQTDHFYAVHNTFHSFVVTEPHLKGFVRQTDSPEMFPSETKNLVQNDDRFWLQVRFALSLLEAIRTTVGVIESADSTLGDVVVHFRSLQKAITKLLNEDRLACLSTTDPTLINQIMTKHEQIFETKLTLMANLLDPKHRGSDLGTPNKTAAAIAAFQEYVDEQVTDVEEKRNVLQAFGQFLSQTGHFVKVFWPMGGNSDNGNSADWWKQFASFPLTRKLSQLCVHLFSIPFSTAVLWNDFNPDTFFNSELCKKLRWSRFRPLLSVYLYLKVFNQQSIRYREYRTAIEQLKSTHPNPEIRPHIEILSESDFELLENYLQEIDLDNYVRLNPLRPISIDRESIEGVN